MTAREQVTVDRADLEAALSWRSPPTDRAEAADRIRTALDAPPEQTWDDHVRAAKSIGCADDWFPDASSEPKQAHPGLLFGQEDDDPECLRVRQPASRPPTPTGCNHEATSSRTCERGTNCCTVRHESITDDEIAGVWAAIRASRYAVEHDDEASPVKAVEYVVEQWNLACDQDEEPMASDDVLVEAVTKAMYVALPHSWDQVGVAAAMAIDAVMDAGRLMPDGLVQLLRAGFQVSIPELNPDGVDQSATSKHWMLEEALKLLGVDLPEQRVSVVESEPDRYVLVPEDGCVLDRHAAATVIGAVRMGRREIDPALFDLALDALGAGQ